MKENRLPLNMGKRQFLGLSVFGIVIILAQIFFSFYQSRHNFLIPDLKFSSSTKSNVLLENFNPNDLNDQQWKNLGFTERQVSTILKYKDIVGGVFTSKEQIKKCYAISEEKYIAIADFILLPEKSKPLHNGFINYSYEKRELKLTQKFNPDLLSENDWKSMGFSEKQAAAIIKYKHYLGGSFVSKEKLKECFIISEENYYKMAPYVILPEKTPKNFLQYQRKLTQEKPIIHYFEFNPNNIDIKGYQSLGFTEKQAQVIVNYRDKNLNGNFKNLEDFQRCFVISEEKFNELKPYIKLSILEKQIEVSSEMVINQKTDFSKIDLNKITFNQLREFGFEEKQAAGFISFRKKLGGFSFKNQVLDVYYADKELCDKLITACYLTAVPLQKFNLLSVDEETLKNNPYFSYYANKIIYYRITYPDEAKIFKFLNAKPEDVTKMRMFLK